MRTDSQVVSGLFVLTPAESKRLIAKGVARLPEVRKALEKGRVIIALGSTNAFVAEEILGREIEKSPYISGHITRGALQTTPKDPPRSHPFVLVDGQVVDISPTKILPEFEAGDVFIKGANAVDVQGNAGILVAGDLGGTIGSALGILAARGAHVVVPVGLEKRVASVVEASKHCGTKRFKYHLGLPVGFMPLVNALVVTEVEALATLTGVRAIHVASGGIGGSEGSVVLAVEGTDEEVRSAFELVKSVKGEPPVPDHVL